MIKDRNLSYSERINRLNITTLETRRDRGDLIQVFKIFKGLDNVQHSDFFIMADTELRGHELKVYKPQVHLDININTTRSPYGTIMNNPYRLLSDTSSSSSFLSNWKSFICVINNSDCKYFFSVRIVDAWNNLPDAVLRCNTVENFKRKLDCLFKDRGHE